MKVRDLLEEIKNQSENYDSFLDWDVAVEHHEDLNDCSNCKDATVTDSQPWTYIKCHGFWTKMPKEKVFTINIHY